MGDWRKPCKRPIILGHAIAIPHSRTFILSLSLFYLILFFSFLTNTIGPVIILNLTTNHVTTPGSSIYKSPLFNISTNQQTVCLRFNYIIYSPIEQLLRVKQLMKSHDYQPRLVWMVNETSSLYTWKYAEVPISSLSEFKVNNIGIVIVIL